LPASIMQKFSSTDAALSNLRALLGNTPQPLSTQISDGQGHIATVTIQSGPNGAIQIAESVSGSTGGISVSLNTSANGSVNNILSIRTTDTGSIVSSGSFDAQTSVPTQTYSITFDGVFSSQMRSNANGSLSVFIGFGHTLTLNSDFSASISDVNDNQLAV